jgi:HD superfamily phosphohydrolase
MKIDPNKLADEFRPLKRLPNDFNVMEESEYLSELVNTGPLSSVLGEYDEPWAEGGGGSGLVISARYIPHNNRRIIKVPRKKISNPLPNSKPSPIVDPELHALSKISHKNITRLYDSHPLGPGKGHCMITEIVEDKKSFDEYARMLCGSELCRQNELERARALAHLAQKTYEIVDALLHMHKEAGLIHFDVKPDNILVSKNDRPFVTDLGFARDINKYGPDEKVEVGFTYKYSHPRLHEIAYGAIVTRVPEKSKNWLEGKELEPKLDVFAFGRTIQELLKTLETIHGESIYADYTFSYLHLLACLCLDGKNAANKSTTSFVSDQALGMPPALFAKHKLESFVQVKVSLERLLGLRRLEHEIPELDNWASATISVSDFGITTFTHRVKTLVEHPSMYRLTEEHQLGMLETVFPTATHTRFQHSLGVYHAVREYMTALYYDPENPTFRVLFSEADCKRALLATLVHDVGHTAFGHDLEEIDDYEFSHYEIGKEVLRFSSARDSKGRFLRDLVTGKDIDCWDISLEELEDLLGGRLSKPIDGVYQDILDGQLDADKLDYLVRDSIESRVKYGQGIDYSRFLRSLTTIVEIDNDVPMIRLAVKQKGAASAEAFAFARYQLYQSLYWHHTFRAIKAMLLTSASQMLDEVKRMSGATLLEKGTVRAAYIDHVIAGRLRKAQSNALPKKSLGKKTKDKTLSMVLEELLAKEDEPETIGAYANEKTLRFLWKLSSGKARKLIEDLIARRYYKRVVEIPLADFTNKPWLWNMFKERRKDLQERVEKALVNSLMKAIQDKSTIRESLVQDDALAQVQRISNEKVVFTVDLPLRGWTSSGKTPIFVSDYKRRHFRIDVGMHRRIESETLWSKQLGEMMERIAFFRIFCEPSIHQILTKVLQTSDIIRVLKSEFKEFDLRTKTT